MSRPLDLIYYYLFYLPEDAVEAGTTIPIDHLFDQPPYWMGPLHCTGELKVVKKQGPIYYLQTTLKVAKGEHAHDHARFIEGEDTPSAGDEPLPGSG